MAVARKIVLDTNFLMIPGQFKVDIFKELKETLPFSYKLYIVDKTVQELEKLVDTGNTRDKTAASIALKLIEQQDIGVLKALEHEDVDSALVRLEAEEDTITATQDQGLKQKLKHKIILRKKQFIQLVE